VALIPIVLMGEVAGLELVRPLGVVMLGGLLTSTVLALLVMPALYLRYGFVAAPDLSAEELVIDLTDVGVEVKQ
jgi:Cu/Ag efflux pump CusA